MPVRGLGNDPATRASERRASPDAGPSGSTFSSIPAADSRLRGVPGAVFQRRFLLAVVMVSGVGGMSSGEMVLGGSVQQSWWLVVDEEEGSGRIVAGPFPDRVEADWAAAANGTWSLDCVRPVYGVRRADGELSRRPSPRDRAWLEDLEDQLDRLPNGWDVALSDDHPLLTLVVEVAGALFEAGLPLHDSTGTGCEVGGVCLSPELALAGIVVTWRQHDRISVDQVHGAAAHAMVQQVMSRALADVLLMRGFAVDAFGSASGHIVRAGWDR